MTLKRAAIVGIGLVLLAVSAVSFYWYNKPRQTVEDVKADHALTAAALYEAYQQNEAAADKEYLNKVIQVTGHVSAIQRNEGTAVLQLSAGDALGGISCRTVNDKAMPSDEIINKEITIKGRCTGFLMDVNLVDCIVVQKQNL